MQQRQFVKVYDEGLERLQRIARHCPTALPVWVFLTKRLLAGEHAVVASAQTIADEVGLSVRTVERAVRDLRIAGAFEVRKIANVNCYILNSDEVWKGAEVRQHFASVTARVVVGYRENPDLAEALADRIAQPDLPGVVPGSAVSAAEVPY